MAVKFLREKKEEEKKKKDKDSNTIIAELTPKELEEGEKDLRKRLSFSELYGLYDIVYANKADISDLKDKNKKQDKLIESQNKRIKKLEDMVQHM